MAADQIPLFAPLLIGSDMDWKYSTERQQNACLAMVGQKCPWARGKGLGGSSAINFMLYVRGNRRDYDIWRNEYGAEGWAYNDVLPHFKSIERTMVPDHDGPLYRGTAGEVPVMYPNERTKLSAKFLKACLENHYPIVDYNGQSQAGCSRVQANIQYGKRYSAAESFINPVMDRPNLHLAMNSHATKVLIQGNRATGIRLVTDVWTTDIMATREVVISAGAVGTPQLLLLSGIGPRQDLNDLQKPVGNNHELGSVDQGFLVHQVRTAEQGCIPVLPGGICF
nr:glucose dehydrogenase [FAD, quinone]-like [Rhipicephalus microplus]